MKINTSIRKHLTGLAFACAIGLGSGTAGAATLGPMDFSSGASVLGAWQQNGLSLSQASIDNSANCPTSPDCSKLNSGAKDAQALTAILGGTFEIVSFWFRFSGNNGVLTVTPDGGPSFSLTEALFPKNQDHKYTFAPLTFVTSLLFSDLTNGGGVVRIDCINGGACDGQQGPSEVPLPAALPLFLAGLGGLGWLSRSRKRKLQA